MRVHFAVRRELPGERRQVQGVVKAAFEREAASEGKRVAALEQALYDDPNLPNISLVATVEEDVIGQVMLTRSWVDAPSRLVDVWVLSPISVLPLFQGHGIGSALMQQAVLTLNDMGIPLLFLEGPPNYYRRFGFSPGEEHGFVSPSVRIPREAFQVKQLNAYQQWMKGSLVYADAFWRMDCVGLRVPSETVES